MKTSTLSSHRSQAHSSPHFLSLCRRRSSWKTNVALLAARFISILKKKNLRIYVPDNHSSLAKTSRIILTCRSFYPRYVRIKDIVFFCNYFLFLKNWCTGFFAAAMEVSTIDLRFSVFLFGVWVYFHFLISIVVWFFCYIVVLVFIHFFRMMSSLIV